MIYFDFSCSQLECMADSLNRRYDESRLTQPKQVDVYDIVDLFQARSAFEYLSPDRTYLGATLFVLEAFGYGREPVCAGHVANRKTVLRRHDHR